MKKLIVSAMLIGLLLGFSGGANADSTIALQERCAEGARKLVAETGGCSFINNSNEAYTLFCEYRCHYNKKLDRCFIRWDYKTIWSDKAAESLRGKRDKAIDIVDVFDRKFIARYDDGWAVSQVLDKDIFILERNKEGAAVKLNLNLEEFERLIKSYMEE